MAKEISFESLCEQLEPISIEFFVDYSLEDLEDNLGALSPFIIDVDVDTTTALIRVEFRLKPDEKVIWRTLEESYYPMVFLYHQMRLGMLSVLIFQNFLN